MPKIKADIDFEKDLWKAANELRGAVAENQYKDYVLSLIFLKYMSERYTARKDELSALLEEPQSPYYTTNKEERDYILNDSDEYVSHNTYILPQKATWEYLKENAQQDDIKVKVDDAFDLMDVTISEFRSDLKGILPRIFVKSQLSATQVSGLINLFSNKKFSELENPESDVLGRIYEYYIGKFAQAEGSGAGQFFTPGSIVRLLVEMLEPYEGKIFDAACGSGGMFVQSLKFLQSHGKDRSSISIYGQERYNGTLRLCKMNLALRNLSFDVRLGDSLLDDQFPDLKADYIIANPPFNVSSWHAEKLPENDPRLFGPRDEFATDGNANYLWMQTFWSHLSNKGTAAIVMANGAMTSNNKGEKNVREHMVNHQMIDCIVRLPDKLFSTTGIPACIFLLSKNRDGKDGLHRERLNEVLFIDASKHGEMVSRKLRVFSDDVIEKITVTYHNWRNLPKRNPENNTKRHSAPDAETPVYKDQLGFCYSASLDEVIKQDYKLTPGIYVGTEEEEDDGIPFEEKMLALETTLLEQFEKSNELQERIKNNLVRVKK